MLNQLEIWAIWRLSQHLALLVVTFIKSFSQRGRKHYPAVGAYCFCEGEYLGHFNFAQSASQFLIMLLPDMSHPDRRHCNKILLFTSPLSGSNVIMAD